ncbi:MAG: hypothetical protein ABIH23_27220 [bacterium]
MLLKRLSDKERRLLRDLAAQVAEIAGSPEQEKRRELWKRHNRLENVGPLILCFPEGAWRELLPENSITIDDPFWREIELELKRLIYHFTYLHDDRAVEPRLRIWNDICHSGWGMETPRIGATDPTRAWKWDPPLKDPGDLSKLHYPELVYDENEAKFKEECAGGIRGSS